MKRVLKFFSWVSVGFVASCATTRAYEDKLQSWVGRDTTELRAVWGEPKFIRSFPNGTKIYEYRALDKETKENTARKPAEVVASCRTFFAIDARGYVSSWKWEGHNCRAE